MAVPLARPLVVAAPKHLGDPAALAAWPNSVRVPFRQADERQAAYEKAQAATAAWLSTQVRMVYKEYNAEKLADIKRIVAELQALEGEEGKSRAALQVMYTFLLSFMSTSQFIS